MATSDAASEQSEIVVWGDNEKRIKSIQGLFLGTLPEPLLKPGRVLVGEGILLKQCRKKLKPRQFYLFNDMLLYANILVNKKSYNKPHFLHLKDISVTATEDEKAIQIFNPERSFLVYTATTDEAREWAAHINLCIKKLPANESAGSKANHAAIWIPDKNANTCMICSTTKFTLINRRHHCRQCGRVACGQCTKQKVNLPPNNTAQRVCNSCFEFLTTKAGGDAAAAAATPATDVVEATAALTVSTEETPAAAADVVQEEPMSPTKTGPTEAQEATADPDDDDDDEETTAPTSAGLNDAPVAVSVDAAAAAADGASENPDDSGNALDAMFAFTHNARASVFFMNGADAKKAIEAAEASS